MRQPAVLFIHRYPGPLLGPGSVRSILRESLVKDQLLNMNHFRQRCIKARAYTPILCTIQIARVLLEVVRPGGFKLPAFWFVGKQSKTLSAASGVAYRETRHLPSS